VYFGERGSKRSENSGVHIDPPETVDVYISDQEVGAR
jgi:hypothetical protein